MPTPIITKMLLQHNKIELPPECVFYIDPNLDRGKTTLTDWARLYGKTIGTDAHLDLTVVDSEVYAPNGIIVKHLNGAEDHFYCNNHSNIDITSVTAQKPLSIFGFINVDTDFSTAGYIMCKNLDSSSNIQYGYYVTPNAISVWLNGSQRAISSNVITKGKWQFVGFIFNGSEVNIYVNGQSVKNTVYTASTLTSYPYFNIGRRAPENSHIKGSLGIQFICQSSINDIMLWVNKLKLFQKYDIAI